MAYGLCGSPEAMANSILPFELMTDISTAIVPH